MTIGDDYAGRDFYCDVAIPHAPKLTVVHDDDHVLAFHHTKPHWETHVVVVPKRHIASLTAAGADDASDLQSLFLVVQTVARQIETSQGAASVLTNLGAYQDSRHLHIHVHSGTRTNTA